MSWEAVVLLVLLAAAFLAFFREIWPIEVTALGLLAVLVAVGIVPAEVAFAGFANKAVLTIGALFVLAEALTRSGVLELAAELLSRKAQRRSRLAIGLLLAAAALASGFLNNTAVVAMLIPLAVALCGRLEVSPSRVLMPLSYAAIFGGTLTLIGTSTNLLVSSITEGAGQRPIGMFELTPLGLVFLAVGLFYLLVLAPKLLPDRGSAKPLTAKYGLGPYLTRVVVEASSKLVGKTLRETRLAERYGVLVVELERDGERLIERIGALPIVAGDRLFVEGPADKLVRMRRDLGVSLRPDVELSDRDLGSDGLTVAEGIVNPIGAMVGKTLEEVDFRRHFGGYVLAIRRLGETVRTEIGRVRLHAADSLLMLVPEKRLDELRRSDDLLVVSETGVRLERERYWWLVLLLLPLAVALAAADLVDIAVGAPLAAVALLVFKVLTPQQAYRSIHWSVLFMIAAFLPVGQAFVTTGAAEILAGALVGIGGLVRGAALPFVVLSLLYLLTSLLTEVVSNNAAAIILVPIALSLGPALGVDSRPFVIAVCFAASAAFMTPMGYQTNLMVYGPGGYRFLDYTRFGVALNIVFWLIASLLIPLLWPL